MSGIERVIKSGGLSSELTRALAARTAALARGIDADIRPADVAVIASRRPDLAAGVLTTREVTRARSLINEAMAGLDVRIHSNVGDAYAHQLLTRGGRLGNAYDVVDASGAAGGLRVPDEQAVSWRGNTELQYGFFGTGTTIYGTVHFADVTHEPLANHAVKLLRYRDRRLDIGATSYGGVSLVLGQRALRNATFLPADTGVLGGRAPLRAVEHLDDVVLEWMLRNFHADQPAARGAGEIGDSVFNTPVTAKRLTDDFRGMLAAPRAQAVAAIREHLTSDAVNSAYMEAQVRIATADDIRGVNAARFPDYTLPAETIKPYAALHDSIKGAAQARGIPFRSSDQPVPRRVAPGA